MLITKELLDKWGVCNREQNEQYSDKNLLILSGGKTGLTPLEVLDLDIPARDKVFVLLRQEVLGERFMEPVTAAVKRAKEYAVVASSNPAAYANYAANAACMAAKAATRAVVDMAANTAVNATCNIAVNAAVNATCAAAANTVSAFDARAKVVAERQHQVDDIRKILEEMI